MLNKNTILFFTETDQKEIAEAVLSELPKDGSAVGVVVERKELNFRLYNKIVNKLFPENSKVRIKMREWFLKKTAMKRDGKEKEPQSVVFDRRNYLHRHILNVYNRFNPTVVCVMTALLLPDVIAVNEVYGAGVKIVVLSGDYVLDRRIVMKAVDRYFVDNFSMRNDLVEVGVGADKIEIANMPVLRKFYQKGDSIDAKKKLGLGLNNAVLVCASKLGDKRFVNVVKEIEDSDLDVNVVVAYGKNAEYLKDIREIGVEILNDAEDMNIALDACEVLVTRPTNVIIAEALAKEKKVFCLYPATRAEEANLKYLALQSVVRVRDEEDLVRKLKSYYASPVGERDKTLNEVEKDTALTVANKLIRLGDPNPPAPDEADSL